MPGWEEGWLTCSSPAKLSRRWRGRRRHRASRRLPGRQSAPTRLDLLERARRRPPPFRGRRPQGRSDPPCRSPPRIAAPARRHRLNARAEQRDRRPELRGRVALLDGDPRSRTAPPARHRPGQPAGLRWWPAGAGRHRRRDQVNSQPGTMTDCGRRLCGFAFADRGHDLRLIQDYPGHRNPKHRVHYTRISGSRFESIWRY
jgi:hypothetical protein